MATIIETTDAATGLDTIYNVMVGDIFSGSVAGTDEVDRVLVDLVAGATYTVILSGLNGGSSAGVIGMAHYDTGLRYWSAGYADGAIQGNITGVQADDSSGDWRITFVAPVSGEYSMFVDDNGDASAGAYTMSVNLASGAQVVGTSGNDFLEGFTVHGTTGQASHDLIDGRAGDDTLYGYGGDDTLIGGAGDDYVAGGAGDDVYEIGIGDGVAVGTSGNFITEYAGEGTDTLRIRGISVADLRMWGGSSKALGIDDGSGGIGEVLLEVSSGNPQDFWAFYERFEFDDGTVWDATTGYSEVGLDTGQDHQGTDLLDRIDGRAGDDTLYGYGGDDTLIGGAGDDYMAGGAGDDVYEVDSTGDAAFEQENEGTDTVRTAVSFTLGENLENLIYTGTGGFVGGGNARANGITGGAQNDWITPGGGSDTIDGGAGRDMLSFYNLAETPGRTNTDYRLDIDMGSGTAVSHDGSESIQFTNIERLTATIYADRIRGSDGDDEIRGLGDYDWIIATLGNDTIDGGTGQDMISFLEWQSTATNVIADVFSSNGLPPTGAQATGVVVDLSNPASNTNLASGLSLTSVERVTGSGRQDVFYGDSGENDFRGLGDYDWFVSSTGGRERYFGGDGVDTVTYFNASSGVIANLRNGAMVNGQETGYGTGGDAARDLFFEIENLVGSRFDDSLTGNSGRNQLNGLEGDDMLFGFGGVDYLMGGAGNDTLNGGGGIVKLLPSQLTDCSKCR